MPTQAQQNKTNVALMTVDFHLFYREAWCHCSLAESYTRPAREKQRALLSLSISRQKLTIHFRHQNMGQLLIFALLGIIVFLWLKNRELSRQADTPIKSESQASTTTLQSSLALPDTSQVQMTTVRNQRTKKKSFVSNSISSSTFHEHWNCWTRWTWDVSQT